MTPDGGSDKLNEKTVMPTSRQNLSSIESLTRSVETDGHVSRWFLFLVLQRAVREELFDDNSLSYRKLDSVITKQRVSCLVLILLSFAVLFSGNYVYLPVLLIPLGYCLKLQKDKRKRVAAISRDKLLKDFDPSELGEHTLYQISEIYAKRYGITSLVDAITALDDVRRKTVIYLFILNFFMLQWQFAVLFAFTAYNLVLTVANSDAVYAKYRQRGLKDEPHDQARGGKRNH